MKLMFQLKGPHAELLPEETLSEAARQASSPVPLVTLCLHSQGLLEMPAKPKVPSGG